MNITRATLRVRCKLAKWFISPLRAYQCIVYNISIHYLLEESKILYSRANSHTETQITLT